MTSYNPQLRHIEDNYRDVKGAITHLRNVHNYSGQKIEKIDDEFDIFYDNRNDYRYDTKDITKILSSNEFVADGDNTPSMFNEAFLTPPHNAKDDVMNNVSVGKYPFQLRAGGGVTNKKKSKYTLHILRKNMMYCLVKIN